MRAAWRRAWQVHQLGDPSDVVSFDEVPRPSPGTGQVLVEVRAAGLDFLDVLMAQGRYQKKYALMDAASAWPVPDAMTDEQAAAFHLTYQTGHVGLHRRAHLQAGETLLVHAGAGGVGSAAIPLGKAVGATVIATAGGPEKIEVCRQLGADSVVDYLSEDFVAVVEELTGGRGADVVYDPVGGDVFDRSRRCIAFEGRLVVVGFAGGRIPEAPAAMAALAGRGTVGKAVHVS